jgi:hypothetical protein
VKPRESGAGNARLTRRIGAAAVFSGLALASAARGANLAPASGIYGATMGAGAATAAERSAFGQNPAALRPGGYGLRLDYQKPYGVADLEVAEAGIYLDGRRLGGACDWRVTSITEVYSEQGFRASGAWRILDREDFPGRIDVGYGLTAWRTALAGAGPGWDPGQEAGIAWRPWPRLKAGGFAAGLPWPPRRDAPGRVMQVGLEADSRAPDTAGNPAARGQILRFDFRKNGDAPWRALASISAHPFPAAEASLGLAAHPFQAAAGVSIAWRGLRLREAARYHRYLGRTFLSGLAFGR